MLCTAKYSLCESWCIVSIVMKDGVQGLVALDLNLTVCPTRNLNDEVDNGLIFFVGIERDVMPWRDGIAVQFQPHTPVLRTVRKRMISSRVNVLMYCDFRLLLN